MATEKILKLESPWLGPFQVKEVFHNSLSVMVSPSLGGLVKINMSMVKKWEDIYEVDDIFDDKEIFEVEEESQEEMTNEEMAQQGFYNVEAILKHKYAQGWRFLVHWDGFSAMNATWEPVRSFKQPGGAVNSTFRDY